VAALPAPNDRERTQWYFQRYVSHLPAAGEMVLFDRQLVQPRGRGAGNGLLHRRASTKSSSARVPEFEKMLVRSGIQLIKYWFSITDEEQHTRFLGRIHDPLKQWKLSPMDLESRVRWEEYTKAKETMLERTHIPGGAHGGWCRPWTRKRPASTALHHLLEQIPYHGSGAPARCSLPARVRNADYIRHPVPPEHASCPSATEHHARLCCG